MTKNRDEFPFRVAGRYEVKRLLGRGGMASVYEAWDEAQERAVALKLLAPDREGKQSARMVELFEREFHTLMQLAHPRIVRALDYGVDEEQPYYALELLDGGDLRELAPLPWQEVCTIAYEICSALSLLHSRGFVHRDLTPPNIRRTQSGQAKLIDFGLLSPMGPTTLLAGTAPFVPPELVRAMSLDARSDLFSLGATLYFALTKRQPHPARSFEHLHDAWRTTPPRPSSIVAGVPRALDDLVMAMLRIDAGSRPKSAAEVMERLLPLLSSPADDELRAARAYLVAPKLVGRESAVARFRRQLMQAVRGRGGGFVVAGAEGTGRSRALEAFILEAKLIGATAVRAGRDDAARPFGVAATIAQQLHRAAPAVAFAAAAVHPSAASLLFPDPDAPGGTGAPELADVTRPGLDRAALQDALRTWILEFSSRRPLAIAIDDVDRIDEPSAALLASLTWEAPRRKLAYLATLPPDDGTSDGSAIRIVRQHAEHVALDPLTENEVYALLASVFGHVPNLGVLSARCATLSGGRPRECMMLAQYLVDAGALTYAGGSWTLPAVIPDSLLPENMEAAFARRVGQLSPLARHLAFLLAENLVERLSRADIVSLDLAPPVSVDAAVAELKAARLVAGDEAGYALSGQALAGVLKSQTHGGANIHDELSALHERAGRHPLLVAYHGLRGSRAVEMLARIAAETPSTDSRTQFLAAAGQYMGEEAMARAVDLALRTAERLERPAAELQSLRGMLGGLAARGADAAYFYRIAEPWLLQAKRDSGYDDWQSLDAGMEPQARAMMAIGAAIQRYGSTPEADRGMTPQEGIQQLVAYVLFGIAISARLMDSDLAASLPELLVPSAPLSPMVQAILENARATCLNREGRRELSRDAFEEVLRQLERVDGAELRYVDAVRTAVCYAIAASDTALGINSPSLARYIELQDPNHQVSALFLQKLAALQRGDWEAAERLRQQAELRSLQTRAMSMFSTIGDELEVHAMARDLTGVRQLRASIRATAEKVPTWQPMLQVADAHYLRLCGDPEGALAAVAPTLVPCPSERLVGSWTTAGRVLSVQLLVELGRSEDAIAAGLEHLADCAARGMKQQVRQLSLSIALAEAALGRFAQARSRADEVIGEQVALGVTGLQLGYSHEVAARISILENDADGFRAAAARAAEQYRPGESSVLGALYERLIDEARRSGLIEGGSLPLAPSLAETALRASEDITSLIAGCDGPRERAERALGLLCDGDPPTRGHLLVAREEGLILAASNTPCNSVTELVSFASERMQRESQVNSMETDALSSIDFGAASTEWQHTDGTTYEVVLIATTISDSYCIGGVALLAKNGELRAHHLTAVAEAVARALLVSGDAVAVAAA